MVWCAVEKVDLRVLKLLDVMQLPLMPNRCPFLEKSCSADQLFAPGRFIWCASAWG